MALFRADKFSNRNIFNDQLSAPIKGEQRGTKLGGSSGFQRDTGAGAGFGLGRSMGGTLKGYDGEGQPIFDYSQSFKPKTKAESVGQFDLSGMDQAISGYRNPGTLTQSYKSGANFNPYQFNFSGDVNKLADEQYGLGSKDIRREGAGSLEKLRETTGTRRPGLLSKLGEDSQRGMLENLGTLRGNLNVNAMNQSLDLNKAQQLAQAAENTNSEQNRAGEGYKEYASRSDLEKSNLDNVFKNLGALSDTSGKKAGMESDIYERDRSNEMAKIQQLLDAYMSAKTSTPQKSGGVGGMIKSGIGAAAGIASKFI